MNNKFILNEMDNGKTIRKVSFSKKYIKLREEGLVSFHNYFIDSGCGFAIIELREWFYVELYIIEENLHEKMPHDDHLMYMKKKIKQHDPLEIFKNFILESRFYLNKKFLLDMIKIEYIPVLSNKLIFSKSKFSRKECEYWSNMSLKN